MRWKNCWMLAAAAMFGLVNVGFGAEDETSSKSNSSNKQSQKSSSDEDAQSKTDADRHIAAWLGCVDACEIELAKCAIGKADVDSVNKFLRRQADEHQSMLKQLRKFAPDAGSGISQSDSGNESRSSESASSDSKSNEGKAARFNWRQVRLEVANENLRALKKELRDQKGLDFDWTVVGQQKMIHDTLAAELKVLRKYASSELREVLDDELADVKRCQRTLDDIMTQLKSEEEQRFRKGSARDSQASAGSSSKNSASARDRSGRGSNDEQGYIEEYGYAETAFTTAVRLDRGSNGRAKLGVTFDTDRKDECEIASVRSGGPADKAGIEAGDVILAVNGSEVNSVDELRQALAKVGDGERVQLVVDRARAASGRFPIGDSVGQGERQK